ncbi:response regulator [Streptomyces cavernae]|uniref:response regulator n=1 Tax=Streptomyces cavernae TaxID=2259034 RepID=UPI000FEB75D0|nr:response regulator transcription factor [Streptomyces cavernae]
MPDETPHETARPAPLRVLVADDNPVVRAGLTALLGAHPDIRVVADAADGAAALEAATRTRPDIVLLDVRMPGTDGLTALPDLVRCAPVLMLTYSREPEVVATAVRLGAVGYLVHGEFTADELIEAVRDMRDGKGTFTPSATRWARPADAPLPDVSDSLVVSYEPNHLSSQMQPGVAQSSESRTGHSGAARPTVRDFGLSSREVEVMDLIASGMSNRQIAATCFITEKTVKNHINRIFAKLHTSTRSEAIAHWLGTAHGGWTR